MQYYVDAIGRRHSDVVPWCAAFVGSCLKRAGRKSSGSLLARSYLKWGAPIKEPIPGCIAVLKRGASWQGHVGFVESVGDDYITVIGGNQGDAVTRARFPKYKVVGYRWPAGAKT